jgi:hypothetical protein
VNQISQQIAHGSRVGGVVVILVYDTITDTTDAYNSLLNDVMPGDVRVVQTVGEQSQVKVLLFISIEQVGLIFVRCNTVVFINLLDTLYPEDAIAFAQRLDERISEIICP